MSSLIAFRPGGAIRELRARHDEDAMSQGAKRDLERYYELLREELKGIRLTADEAELLCDVLKPPASIGRPRLLWAEVETAINDAKDPKRAARAGKGLVEKLRDLGPAAACALVDAVERYHRNPIKGPRLAALVVAGFITAEDQRDWEPTAARKERAGVR